MSDATLDIAGAALRVGGQVVPVRVAGDGRVGAADGPMLAPITFGERWRAVRWAGPERDRCAALAAALVHLASGGMHRMAPSTSLDELIALLLAGAGTPSPSFAEAAAAAGRLGWGLADVSAALAIDVDALAGPPTTRPELGGWSRVVLASDACDGDTSTADDELLVARDALADDLFARDEVAPAEHGLDEAAADEPAPGRRASMAGGVPSDRRGDRRLAGPSPPARSPATVTAASPPTTVLEQAPSSMSGSQNPRTSSPGADIATVGRRVRSQLRAVDLGHPNPASRRTGPPPSPAIEVHPSAAPDSGIDVAATHRSSATSVAPPAEQAAERRVARAPATTSRRAERATSGPVADVARSSSHRSLPAVDRTTELTHVVTVALADGLHREADRRGVPR